ncbi:MAG: sigma-70 family RNA polymerase sigma factor [Armatimonadetes bacterium]|nr:sigma-70 family RNA polymerase sigma factor [Armatimonadota bacterium]
MTEKNLGQAWSAEYEDFVFNHCASLVRTLSFITLDRGIAEDAAQEAFLQLLVHWPRVRAMDDPVGWVYRVGINRCRDYRRAARRANRIAERILQPAPSRQEAPWSSGVEVMSVLASLPRRQRMVAVLFFVAGHSTAEIAHTMGISQGAVGSHLHKARKKLRMMLEADYGSE